jgi:transcriptional regulator with XRE-family HTH domain
MRLARADGMTLRAIADATGLSHETIRRLLRDT